MELFTLDRKFLRDTVIDRRHSLIWTERYYGDGEFELVAPATPFWAQKLAKGTFIGLEGSKQVGLIESQDSEKGALKLTGNHLLPFLNHRFIRSSSKHEDRYWYLSGMPCGDTLGYIVQNMCVSGPYLDGTIPIGIPNALSMAIPGLKLGDQDHSGSPVTIAVPFGPVFDALRQIASTYQVGMTMELLSADDSGYSLEFRSYKGLDRTSSQDVNERVIFSPDLDSLTNIKELQAITGYKTNVYSFAPSNPEGLATVPGVDTVAGVVPAGFDLRAMMTFEEDITTDTIGGSAATLNAILKQRAHDALMDHTMTQIVDGEVTSKTQFKYGIHYNMGDIVELQGNSGILQRARITEYIRTEDDSGEKAYPTVSVIS